LERENPKPYRSNKKKVHGLLRCKNVKCNKYWNRDVLGSQNMLDKGMCILQEKEIPKALSRKFNNQGSLTTVAQSTSQSTKNVLSDPKKSNT